MDKSSKDYRGTICTVNLQALIDNYLLVKKTANSFLFAAVKARAYGHGLLEVAYALRNIADGFAVAFLSEAIAMRVNGVTKPILLLEGLLHADEINQIVELDIWIVVHTNEQLHLLHKYVFELNGDISAVKLFIKFNLGMNRLGFDLTDKEKVLVQAHKLSKNLVLMSHFACADIDVRTTVQQYLDSNFAIENMPVSVRNSAALINTNIADDYARAGLAIYGIKPTQSCSLNLKPVMSLHAKIIAIQNVIAGEYIGYANTYKAIKDMNIAIVSIGYADGYPLVNKPLPVFINNTRTYTVGRATMDMLMIDVTDIQAQIGDIVELWGVHINVNEVAQAAGTISYQLLSSMQRICYRYIFHVEN